MNSEKTVNLYFSKLPETSVLDTEKGTDGSALKFIILQNDELHRRIEKVTEENRELLHNNEELEDQASTADRRNAVIKGYLKNEHALNVLYRQLLASMSSQGKTDERFRLMERIYMSGTMVSYFFMMAVCRYFGLHLLVELAVSFWTILLIGMDYRRRVSGINAERSIHQHFARAHKKSIDELIKANDLIGDLLSNL